MIPPNFSRDQTSAHAKTELFHVEQFEPPLSQNCSTWNNFAAESSKPGRPQEPDLRPRHPGPLPEATVSLSLNAKLFHVEQFRESSSGPKRQSLLKLAMTT